MSTPRKKYIPQKVLEIKEQQEEKLLLIKWAHHPIEKATWQTQQKLESFPQIHQLIEEYQKSRTMDKRLNFHIKNAEKTEAGQNPYYETSRHGHFLYGDEVDRIESVKVYKSGTASEEVITVVCEIRWKDRLEEDQDEPGVKTFVILENTFMDTKTIAEYRPDLLAKFYESRITLKQEEPEEEGLSA